MEKAGQLRNRGQSLIDSGQFVLYAYAITEPQCKRLERVCTEFESRFNRRQTRLRDAQQLWLAIEDVCSTSVPSKGQSNLTIGRIAAN